MVTWGSISPRPGRSWWLALSGYSWGAQVTIFPWVLWWKYEEREGFCRHSVSLAWLPRGFKGQVNEVWNWDRRVMKEFILWEIYGNFYLFQNWSIVLSIDESTWFRTLISAVRVAGWIGIVMAMTLWSSKAPFLKFVFWGCPKGAVQCLVSLRFTFRSTSGSFCGNPQEQSQPQAMAPIFRYYPVSFSST